MYILNKDIIMSEIASARIQSSREWLDYQRNSMQDWFDQRKRLDARGQYTTQLNALHGRLFEALAPFEDALCEAADFQQRSQVYERCQQVDQCVLWLRYFWTFYQEKFDQRDTIEAMKAADEVVWSCY